MTAAAPRLRQSRALGLLVLLVVFLAAPGVAAATPVQAQAASTDAVSSLADCSARTGHVSIVFLVDESASLQKTDPDNRRVEGIQAALHGLANTTERTAGTAQPVSVDVALVGFGAGTTEVQGWTPLDNAHLGGLLDTAGQFASRNQAIDTDYAAAIIGAKDQLSRAPHGNDCTAVLWFTDGEYDIEPRSTGETKSYAPDIPLSGAESAARLEDAGKEHLCKPGGLIDALRTDRTEVLAVALSTDISPENQQFLQAVAEGSSGGATCGSPRPPGSPPAGAYLNTQEVSGLISRFFDLVNRLAGGTVVPTQEQMSVCPLAPCEAGTQKFPVDPGIRSFNLLALANAPGITVQLASAESGSVPLTVAPNGGSGDAVLGAAKVHWTWVAEDALLLDVTLPADQGPWNGQWSATFIDVGGTAPNAVANAKIFVFGDIEPAIQVSDFRAGEAGTVGVGIEHRQGTPVDESLFDRVDVEASVTDPRTGARERLQLSDATAEGGRTATWRPPTPDFPAEVNVSATTRITTASGLALTPSTRTVAAKVLPPSSYPAVEPGSIRFEAVTGTSAQSASLVVRGGDRSGGCAWFEGAQVGQAPSDAGVVTVRPESGGTDAATCIHVDPGQSTTVRIVAVPTSAANGIASGSLPIALRSDTNPEVLRTAVTWSVPLQKPLDTGKAIGVTAVLMAIGLLLPLLLMWLVNWLTAKYDPMSTLKVARIPVTVSPTGTISRRDTGESGIAVKLTDFHGLDGTSQRSFSAEGIEFTSQVSLSPFAAPTGMASAAGYGVGSLPPARVGGTLGRAPVPFGLAGSAVVLVPEPELERAQQAAEALVVGALGPTTIERSDAGGNPAGRRPAIDADIVVFAPSTALRSYLSHFDGQRSSIVALVDTLRDRYALDHVRRDHEGPATAETSTAPGRSSSARSGATSFDIPPPPPTRRSTGGDSGPPARTSGDRRVGGSPAPDRSNAPEPAPSPPSRRGGTTSPTASEPPLPAPPPPSTNDDFGPPPGRTT